MTVVSYHPTEHQELQEKFSINPNNHIHNKSLFKPEGITLRDWLGFLFEVDVQSVLEDNITYEGNPDDYDEWKRQVGKGCDIKVKELDLEIECKFNRAEVYPSYIERDFIPRFSDSKHKVIVTNDLTKYSHEDRELLRKAGIKLLNPIYLLQYIYRLKWKLQHKGCNKYYLKALDIQWCSRVEERNIRNKLVLIIKVRLKQYLKHLIGNMRTNLETKRVSLYLERTDL